MRTRLPIPADRTLEQLRNHYDVERAIALRLKSADREQRTRIFGSMYTELFAKVPDHPRLTRRADETLTITQNQIKMRLLRRFLAADKTVLEFGSGDCRFAYELCRNVKRVYGVDISDQRDPRDPLPPNFDLLVYDGYDLPLEDQSVDVVFSDQLIEHFHPDDTRLHFETVRRILRSGGTYVFRTPNALSGPHDVSMYFSDEAQGFHLKEWTYTELSQLLYETGYRDLHGYVYVKGRPLGVPMGLIFLTERLCARLPKGLQRSLATRLLRETCISARK